MAQALLVSRRSGRIEAYGTADGTQNLQGQTQAHCRAGAGDIVCRAPLPRTLQRRSARAPGGVAAMRPGHHRSAPPAAATSVGATNGDSSSHAAYTV